MSSLSERLGAHRSGGGLDSPMTDEVLPGEVGAPGPDVRPSRLRALLSLILNTNCLFRPASAA